MKTNVRMIAMIGALLAAAAALHAAQPVPKTLTQEKLDRFMREYETVAANETVSAAWDTAFQTAAMEELMNPESELTTADSLSSVMILLVKARLKAKTDAAALAELKSLGWTSEYWDIFVIAQVCIHYASLADFNEQLAQEGYDPRGDERLPPIENFVNGADYRLVKDNLGAIMGKMENERNAANGYANPAIPGGLPGIAQ